MAKTIFVTGGAGFVGSHCVLELLEAGYEVVVIDNLSNAVCNEINHNSLPESLKRVEQLTSRKLLQFYNSDLLDVKTLDYIFGKYNFDAVIHFAALKAVAESCRIPLEYYRNNVVGTINLLDAMKKHGVKKIVFSSSCTVYGNPKYLPLDESHPTGVNLTNPYGRTKYFVEEILKDVAKTEKSWCVISLRYFNPVGAHESGEIGEDPQGIPNNLMPYVSQVAIGRHPHLNVYGNDFDTVDGTGVRDYIHIMDLSRGHVMALDKMLTENWTGVQLFNLGTGRGYSVLEVVAAFEKATGIQIPYKIVERRPGDVDANYADSSKAMEKFGWKANYNMDDMCKDVWKWQSKYPYGFRTNVSNDNEKSGKHGTNGHSNGVRNVNHSAKSSN